MPKANPDYRGIIDAAKRIAAAEKPITVDAINAGLTAAYEPIGRDAARELDDTLRNETDRLFARLDDIAQSRNIKPSDLARYLDKNFYDLDGDAYREWYEEGDEPWE